MILAVAFLAAGRRPPAAARARLSASLQNVEKIFKCFPRCYCPL